MRKLVQDDVLQVARQVVLDVLPREDQCAGHPRFADTRLLDLRDEPVLGLDLLLHAVLVGIEQDADQLREVVGRPVEEQDGRLSEDDELHPVGDVQTHRPFEVFLREKDLDVAVKLLAVLGWQLAIQRYRLLKDVPPRNRKRLFSDPLASALLRSQH